MEDPTDPIFPNEMLIYISNFIDNKETWGKFAQVNWFLACNARNQIDIKKKEFGHVDLIPLSKFRSDLLLFMKEIADCIDCDELHNFAMIINVHVPDDTRLVELFLETFDPYEQLINRHNNALYHIMSNGNFYFLSDYDWDGVTEEDKETIFDWLSHLLRSSKKLCPYY